MLRDSNCLSGAVMMFGDHLFIWTLYGVAGHIGLCGFYHFSNMIVEEAIEKLRKFPPHYRVEVFWDGCGETDDMTAEISEIHNISPLQKIVSIELETRMLPEPKAK